MLLSDAYNQLVSGELPFFIFDHGGHIRTSLKAKGQIHLVPGSFDPLHDAHRWMLSCGKQVFENGSYFETSVKRWDKPDVDLETMKRKLEQFRNFAPVLVTSAPRMIGKIGLLRSYGFYPYWDSVVFHIGMDTYNRMCTDYVGKEMAGLSAKFVVYDRIVNGVRLTLPESATKNCVKSTHPMPEELLTISSTAIRNRV